MYNMEKYLMMLYVTLDQEKALKTFFIQHGWCYSKPDLSRLTDQIGPFAVPVSTSHETSGIEETSPINSETSKATTNRKRVYTKRKSTAKRKCAAENTTDENSAVSDSEESALDEVPNSIPSTSAVLPKQNVDHCVEMLPLEMHCDNGDKEIVKSERVDYSQFSEEIKLRTANDSDLTTTVSCIDSQNDEVTFEPANDDNKDLKVDIDNDSDIDDTFGDIDVNANVMQGDDDDHVHVIGDYKRRLDGTIDDNYIDDTLNTFNATDIETAENDTFTDSAGIGLQSGLKKKRNALSLKEKTEVIKLHQENSHLSHRQLAVIFGVGKTQITCLLKQKAEIMEQYELYEKACQTYNPSSTEILAEIDMLLWSWFQTASAQGLVITGSMLKIRALQYAKNLKISGKKFKASGKWLNHFKMKHNINLS